MKNISLGFGNDPQTFLETLAALLCLPSLILALINWGLYDADPQTQIILYAVEVFFMNFFLCRKPVVLFLAVFNLFLIYVPWGVLIAEPWDLQHDQRPSGWDGRLDDVLRFWFFCSYPVFVWIFIDILKLTNTGLIMAPSMIWKGVRKGIRLVIPGSGPRRSISNGKSETMDLRNDESAEKSVKKGPPEPLSAGSRPPSPTKIDPEEFYRRKLSPIKGMQEEIEKLKASIHGMTTRMNAKVGTMDQQILHLQSRVDESSRNRDHQLEEARNNVAQLKQEVQDLRHQLERPMLEMTTKIQGLDVEITQLTSRNDAFEKTFEEYAAQAEEASPREQRRIAADHGQYGRASRTNKVSFRSAHREPKRLQWAKPNTKAQINRMLDALIQQREQEEESQKQEVQEKEHQREEQPQQEQETQPDLEQDNTNPPGVMEIPAQREEQQAPGVKLEPLDRGNRANEENYWKLTDHCLKILDQEVDELNRRSHSQIVVEDVAVKTDHVPIDPPAIQDAETPKQTTAKEGLPEMKDMILGGKSYDLEASLPKPANSPEAARERKRSDDLGNIRKKPKVEPESEELSTQPQDGGLFEAAIPEVRMRDEGLVPEPLGWQQSGQPEPTSGMIGDQLYQNNQHGQQAYQHGSTMFDTLMTDDLLGLDLNGQQDSGFPFPSELSNQAFSEAPQQEAPSSPMSFTYDEQDIDMSELPLESVDNLLPPLESVDSFLAEFEAEYHAPFILQPNVPLHASASSLPAENVYMSENPDHITDENIQWEPVAPPVDESADLEMSVANEVANENEDLELVDSPGEIAEAPSQSQPKAGTQRQMALETIPEEEESLPSDPEEYFRQCRRRMGLLRSSASGSSDPESEPEYDNDSDDAKREEMAYRQAMIDSDDENPIRKAMLEELDEVLEESDPELEDDYDPEKGTVPKTPELIQEESGLGVNPVDNPDQTGEVTTEAGAEPITQASYQAEGNNFQTFNATSLGGPAETVSYDLDEDSLCALEILEAELKLEFEQLEREGLFDPARFDPVPSQSEDSRLPAEPVPSQPEDSQLPAEPAPSQPQDALLPDLPGPSQSQDSRSPAILGFEVFKNLPHASFSFNDNPNATSFESSKAGHSGGAFEKPPRRKLVDAMRRSAERSNAVRREHVDSAYYDNSRPEDEIDVARRATTKEMAGRKRSQLPKRLMPEGISKPRADQDAPLSEPAQESKSPAPQSLGEEEEAEAVDSVTEQRGVPAPEPEKEDEPDIYSADA